MFKSKFVVLPLVLLLLFSFTLTASAAEITVFVRQPVEGQRVIVSSDFNKGIEVGTCWVVIDNKRNEPFIAHFIPSNPLVNFTEGKILLNLNDIPNKIYSGEEAKKQVEDKPYHAVFRENITTEQANKAISFIQNYTKPYNLTNRNCVDFAEEVLKECNIGTETIFKKNELSAPPYLHEFLRIQGIDPKQTYKSHSPGNLVEDWKELKDPRVKIVNNSSY